MFNLDTSKRLVILSAEQAGKSEADNANATDELRAKLALCLGHGTIDSVVACDGQYKGTPERSFLVICDADSVSSIAKLANAFDQECVLVGEPIPHGGIVGALYFPNSTRERIGRLTPCDPDQDYDASTTIHGTSIAFHFE